MKLTHEQQRGNLLQKSQKQISFMLKERHKIADDLRAELTRLKIESRSSDSLEKHLADYGNTSELIQSIGTASLQRSRGGENSSFWNLNMSIERDVEDNLRQLKEMDNKLDSMVNQEAENCNMLEEVEISIRTILTNKQTNYLTQAEPFLLRKTQCLQALDKIKEVKSTLKKQKLSKIVELLQQLERLKEHRQKRLGYCRNKKMTSQTISLLKLLLADLNQVMNQRRNTQHREASIKKLSKTLDLTNVRITSIEDELLALFEEQQKIMAELHQSVLENEQSKNFQANILHKFNLESTELMPFMDRCTTFIKEEEDKKRELEQILQGVSTTNETIKIFKHIQEAMESENRRRSQLLRRLELIQREQEEQTVAEEKVNEIEGDLEKLESKRQRLLKKLSSKVNQADLSAYKTVNEELEGVDTEFRAKKIILHEMKEQLKLQTRQLANEAALINEEYTDITSEVMPQIWLKGLDYSREETAFEIKTYLSKLLSRLKI